ncbi:MAG: class II aldolase/adducin family protein [Bacillota bacterium]
MDFPELRRELAKTVEELYREKMITATGGNVSVRLPGGQGFLVTPSQKHKGSLVPESMVLLSPEGKAAEGQDRPSVETPMHLKVYEINPTVGAVIHTHAPFATILGLYDKLKIPPFTIESLRFIALPVVPFYMPGSLELAKGVAAALDNNPEAQALLLRNHGLLAVGRNLRQAANVSMALEEACRMAVICRLLGGEPRLIPGDQQALLKPYLGL